MTRTQAIKTARGKAYIAKRQDDGEGRPEWYVVRYDANAGYWYDGSPSLRHSTAKVWLAQTRINYALALLGIDDYTPYKGGNWTDYVKEKTR